MLQLWTHEVGERLFLPFYPLVIFLLNCVDYRNLISSWLNAFTDPEPAERARRGHPVDISLNKLALNVVTDWAALFDV